MSDYKSSVLNMTHDDDCPVCRFVRGERTEENMMETIRALDSRLSEKEMLLRDTLEKFKALLGA